MPAGVVVVAGIVIGASAAASAAVPSLPPKTAQQLLAEVAQATRVKPGPFTATVRQTANLGLPRLPVPGQAGGPDSASLLSGSQSVRIWYGGPQHLRIAVPVQAGESDLRRDGGTVWLWNSRTQTATQVTLPARVTGVPSNQGNGPAGSGGTSPGTQVPDTPQAAASQFLAAIGPTTVVNVQSGVYVAKRAAYQLSLAPKSSQSLISRVVLAIDASSGIPLRVEVYGRGSAGLAYSLEYTSLKPGTPAAANFSFTPPPGATVNKQTVPSNLGAAVAGLGLPAGTLPSPSTIIGKPTVIGSDWLAVIATPPSPAVAAAVQQLLTDHPATPRSGNSGGGFFGSSSSPGPSVSTAVPVGPYLAPLQALLQATTPVSDGRLLQTTLFSVLITNKGQILAGAVTPAVLQADLAKDAG